MLGEVIPVSSHAKGSHLGACCPPNIHTLITCTVGHTQLRMMCLKEAHNGQLFPTHRTTTITQTHNSRLKYYNISSSKGITNIDIPLWKRQLMTSLTNSQGFPTIISTTKSFESKDRAGQRLTKPAIIHVHTCNVKTYFRMYMYCLNTYLVLHSVKETGEHIYMYKYTHAFLTK